MTIHGGIGLYENALTPSQVASNLPTQPPSRISLSLNNPFGYGDFTTAAAPWGQTYDNQLPFPVYGQDPSGNVYSCPAKTDTPNCIYSVNLNGFEPNVKPEKFLLIRQALSTNFRPASLSVLPIPAAMVTIWWSAASDRVRTGSTTPTGT